MENGNKYETKNESVVTPKNPTSGLIETYYL